MKCIREQAGGITQYPRTAGPVTGTLSDKAEWNRGGSRLRPYSRDGGGFRRFPQEVL
jgi:hypothetical protein